MKLALSLAMVVPLSTSCGPRSRHPDGSARREVVINSGQGTQYVQATAVAAAVEKHTPMMAFVEPTKSHVAAMPLFQKGDMDFIFVSQAEMYLANRGAEYYESVGPTPIRVVAAGSEITMSFFAAPDSGIETLADLAGKKLMWDTKSNGVLYWAAKHVLDYYDLHDKIVSIPSPSPTDRAEALKAGRVDAYSCSTQYQAMEILHSSVGVKMLDIPKEVGEWVHERYPAVYPAVCPRGFNGGMVSRDVPVLAASTGLHARADVKEDVVYAVLEAIYDHFDEFAGTHPTLAEMTLERAVSLRSIVPYHPGAVRFFRDRSVWSEEAEAMQGRLLEELSAKR